MVITLHPHNFVKLCSIIGIILEGLGIFYSLVFVARVSHLSQYLIHDISFVGVFLEDIGSIILPSRANLTCVFHF